MSKKKSAPVASKGATVKLPTEIGIDNAAAWRESLLKHVDDTETVTLDARDVSQIHTAAMQLFCMFCNDRRSAGRNTQWQKPSAALRGAAALLGVTTLLQIAREGNGSEALA